MEVKSYINACPPMLILHTLGTSIGQADLTNELHRVCASAIRSHPC